jgi:hypothetical protein
MSDMSHTSGPEPDDSTLIRYLVGRTSDAETEQLDERSIVDEEFAQRLRAVEHDLVDAYTNGELSGDTLEGFRAQYLRSPAGLAQVEFAQALRGYRHAAVDQSSRRRGLARIWSMPRWQLAAAALVLAASGYLLVDDLQLRRQMSVVRQAQTELEQRAGQLQEDLNRQQSSTKATEEELARVRDALAALRASANGEPRPSSQSVLALVLRGATRDAGAIPRLVIPGSGDAVTLILPLVASDFAQYEAILRDAAGDRIIWRSGRLEAPAASDRPMIAVTVGSALLAPGTYSLELNGISTRGDAEPLDTYPFRVVP